MVSMKEKKFGSSYDMSGKKEKGEIVVGGMQPVKHKRGRKPNAEKKDKLIYQR